MKSQLTPKDYDEGDVGDEGPWFGYCYCNAQWGWFWGIWEKLTIENSRPPLLFGFDPSREAVKHRLNRFAYARFIDCGFGISETYYDDLADCNEHAKEYIEFDGHEIFIDEVDRRGGWLHDLNKPIWSRCSSGKKWFWGAWGSIYHYLNGDEPCASGYETSSIESVKAAIGAVGGLKQRGISPAYAQAYLRKLNTIKRQHAPADKKAKGVDNIGFLYTSDIPFFFHGSKKWTRHRVIKQTSKFVYVERRPYIKNRPLTGDWFDYAIFSARLDRQALEQEGFAKSRTMHKWFSNLGHRRKARIQHELGYDDLGYKTEGDHKDQSQDEDEHSDTRNSEVEKAVKFLGLDVPYTYRELKRVFNQKAHEHHPDKGGNPRVFMKLRNALEVAIRHLERTDSFT